VVQPEYNLVSRSTLEGPLAELCQERGLGVCTFFALAAGFLTGKYAGARAEGARANRVQPFLDDPRALATLAAARRVASRRGLTMAQVAIAWQLSRSEVTTPIASATRAEQVRELLGAVDARLAPEDLRELEA